MALFVISFNNNFISDYDINASYDLLTKERQKELKNKILALKSK